MMRQDPFKLPRDIVGPQHLNGEILTRQRLGRPLHIPFSFFFFFTDTATPEIYTLSLHDALPIYPASQLPCALRVYSPVDSHTCQTPDRKSTRLNSSHLVISYAVFCLKKKKK